MSNNDHDNFIEGYITVHGFNSDNTSLIVDTGTLNEESYYVCTIGIPAQPLTTNINTTGYAQPPGYYYNTGNSSEYIYGVYINKPINSTSSFTGDYLYSGIFNITVLYPNSTISLFVGNQGGIGGISVHGYSTEDSSQNGYDNTYAYGGGGACGYLYEIQISLPDKTNIGSPMIYPQYLAVGIQLSNYMDGLTVQPTIVTIQTAYIANQSDTFGQVYEGGIVTISLPIANTGTTTNLAYLNGGNGNISETGYSTNGGAGSTANPSASVNPSPVTYQITGTTNPTGGEYYTVTIVCTLLNYGCNGGTSLNNSYGSNGYTFNSAIPVPYPVPSNFPITVHGCGSSYQTNGATAGGSGGGGASGNSSNALGNCATGYGSGGGAAGQEPNANGSGADGGIGSPSFATIFIIKKPSNL